jgi:antitoxin HicB
VEGDADDALGPGEDRLILAEAFHVLDEDERRLVYMRFIEGASRTKAARELGISQRQLSRRTNAALSKLRAELEGGAGTDNGKARASSPPKAKPTPSKSLSAEGDALNMDAMASGTAREVEKFLELPYHVVITRDPDAQDGAHWKANVEELPGCEARGATSEEAARAIYRAMEDWIGGALAKGANVPEPKRQSQASGRLLLRMPQTLHAELARRADREEVSLNGLITGLLASAVGWQREDGVPSEGSDAAQPPRSRFLSTAILVNIVVMALAAIAAVILLILAWQNL